MLDRNIIVRTGIEGLSPDKKEGLQLEKWLKNHREITKEEKENRRRLFEINVLEKNKKKVKVKIGV